MAASAFVRLRGLPFMTTEQEVAQWFQTAPGGPLQVIRVLFTYNTQQRKTGEAVSPTRQQRRLSRTSAGGLIVAALPLP